MLKAGERAPEFPLPDETAKDRSLTELLSAGAIVLYFYPADFTPGCTRQACMLRDLHTDIGDIRPRGDAFEQRVEFRWPGRGNEIAANTTHCLITVKELR